MNYVVEHWIEDFGFCYLDLKGEPHKQAFYMTFRQAASTAHRFGGIIRRRTD